MYRFTTLLQNSHLVLVRKKLSNGSCAALLVMRTPARRYAKSVFDEKCPPVHDRPKSRKLFWGTITAAVLAGSAVVYAKHSPETRNWLASNIPIADQFVALVYQEQTTYVQFTVDQLTWVKKKIVDFLFGREGISPLDFQQRSEQDLEKDAKLGFAPKTYELPIPTLEPLYVEEKVAGQAEVSIEATLVQTEKCEPPEPPKTLITKEILQLEQDMHEMTKLAIDNYKKGTRACANYTKTLHRIIECPPTEAMTMFNALKEYRVEREKAMHLAKEASAKARCALESLERMIIMKSISAPPENLAQTARYIRDFRADLTAAEDGFNAELGKCSIADKFWEKVEAARKQYKTELEILFPGVDLSAHHLDLPGDTDLLLIYTMKQILFLQNELAEMQTVREYKIQKAIECNDEKALIELKAEDMVKKERLQREAEFQKKILVTEHEARHKMMEELRKQYEIQDELTRTILQKKEQEAKAAANRKVSELIEKEKVEFKKELAAMAGKLKAIEATLKQRAAAEAEARRAQSVWAAAEALLAATRRPVVEALVENEIKALEKAGQGDKLVQTVLNGIPKEARSNPIPTEKALRERFDAVEKTAMKVALIGREGASLPMYFLSWLQSKILFQKLAEIPRNELENLPTDFTKLDTFDIVQRARYHMDHNDLSSALRYVNLLQGAARAAVACWAEGARRHLEVRQAAETVMAHAALSSMQESKK